MQNQRIIMVSMGGVGNAVATAFLDAVFTACGVGPGGEAPADAALAEALGVFCDSTADGRLVPRRILAATSTEKLGLSGSPYAGMYPAGSQVVEPAGEDIGGIWAKGYHAPSVETVLARVMARVEALDYQCIVWLFQGLGGGYGAGAGSRLLEGLNKNLGERAPVVSIAVAPSRFIAERSVEPYSAVLTLGRILDQAEQILMFDNDAMFRLLSKSGLEPSLKNFNQLMGQALATLTAPLLWPDASGARLSAHAFHSALWKPSRLAKETGRSWWSVEDSHKKWAADRLVAISQVCDATSAAETDAELGGRLIQNKDRSLSFPDHSSEHGWSKVFAVQYGKPQQEGGFEQSIPEGHGRIALDPRLDRRRAIAAGLHHGLQALLSRIQEEFNTLYRRGTFLHWYFEHEVGKPEFDDAAGTLDDAITNLQNPFSFSQGEQSGSDGEEAT